MTGQLRYGVANVGGDYKSSENVGIAVDSARAAMADLFNCAPAEVVFGPSMTMLTFHVARALEATLLQRGDEIVLDPLSHRANVSPWRRLAQKRGATVRWLPVANSGSDCSLDTADLSSVITPGRTKLVAVGAASNGTGSVHDVATVCAAASASGALSYVDAVHYAPHHLIDVHQWGCDFAVCSPYKFFGPHSGTLFGRRSLLEALDCDRLDLSDDGLPSADNCGMSRWELGTQNHEALAGVGAAVDYLASLGGRAGGGAADQPASRRKKLQAGFAAIEAHEDELKVRALPTPPPLVTSQPSPPSRPSKSSYLPTYDLPTCGLAVCRVRRCVLGTCSKC